MKAGTLEIEFLTNLAKVQSELSQIKRAVGQTMGDAVAQQTALVRSSENLVTTLDRQATTWGKNADQIRKMDVEAKALALQESGLIDLANQLRAAEERLTVAQNGHSSALGFNRTQFMIAESATHRFIDSILAGQSPLKAFAMQAGDFGNVLAMDSGGVAGGLAKVRALINPVTVGVAAATAVVAAGVVAWQSYAGAIDRLSNLAEGAGAVIGTTGTALEANAEAAAKAGNISVSSAREIESAYVQMGGIGSNVLSGLTSITANYARATGEDLATAEKELGAAMQDPSKGADELTKKIGLLSGAQVEHIQNAQNQNDLYGAQGLLLDGLKDRFDHAADHANGLAKGWHFIATEAANAWNWMGKAIDRAMGGGTLVQQIQDLQQQRTSLLGSNANGMVPQLDKQIADLQAQLRAEQQKEGAAQARSQAVDVMKLVGASTGSDAGDALAANLKKINDLLGDTSNKAGLSTAQIAQLRTAQEQYSHAVSTYLPAGEREVKLAQLSADIAAAKGNPAKIGQLNVQKALLEQSGKLITSAQAQAIATANGTAAQDKATKSGDAAAKAAANHAAMLAREAAAGEAQIKNLYGVADAYGVSGAAALIAEARTKAESQAIKQRGDIDETVARQVRIAVAQRVADAARATAAMNDQAGVQERVNAQVEAGLLPASQASQAIQDQIALLPILSALQAAQQIGDAKGTAEATARLKEMKAAQDGLNASRASTQANTANAGADNQLAILRAELGLIGATDAARTHELATIKAQQDAEAQRLKAGTAEYDTFIQKQVALADQAQKVAEAQAQFNEQLRLAADLADSVGESMSKAFGKVGSALGDVIKVLGEYGAKQEEIDKQVRSGQLSQAAGAKKTGDLQIGSLIDITDAAKSLFKEHSAGYQAMAAAEKALTIIQLARTAVDVAGGAARMFASLGPFAFPAVAAMLGVMASLGFGGGGSAGSAPTSNTGTGTVFGDNTAQSDSLERAVQSLKDVDTVTMQYSSQMAASLRSIEANIGGLTNIIIRTGNINASADVNTGTTVGGQFGIDKKILDFEGKVLGKIPVIGGILSGITGLVSKAISKLFGTTTKIVGSGIYGGSQSLGSIEDGGFDASYYSDVKRTHHFLGISTGSKYSTSYADASPEIEQQFTAILKGFYSAIDAAAQPLGLATDDVEKKLDSFVVNIGKIDLQGLTGEQIQDKLEAVFGAAADSIAQAAIPGLEKYQQVGEGYFETVTRVATTVETVTDELEKLGQTTKSLGIDASMSIAGFFDSLDDYTQASDTYFADYYTQAEQAAAKTAQLGKVFDSLGVAMPSTLADFRKLVEAQDLNTDAGRQMYAELLQLAPAFADLQQSMNGAASAADILREREDLQKQLLEAEGDTVALRQLELNALDASNRALQQQIWDLQDKQKVDQEAAGLQQQIWQLTGDTASQRAAELAALAPANRALQERIYALQDAAAAEQKAAAAAQERNGLLQQLYQLTGDTAALRALQLQALDPSNQALQQQIWAIQDAQAAAQAAQSLSDAWKDVGSSIEDEIKRIRGLTDSPTQGYSSLLAQFNAATAAANNGDQDAAKSLPELSKELLDAAASVATSRQELDRIQAQTAAALQAVADKIAAATKASDDATGAVQPPSTAPDDQSWWQTFANNQQATTAATSAANDKLVSAVQGLRSDIAGMTSDQNTGNATIAANTGKIARILDNVSRPTGGNAIATEAAA